MLEIKKAKPHQVGIEETLIFHLIESLEHYGIPIHSLHIMKSNKLIFEGYFAPYKNNMPHRMFSITKTLTALAILKLVEDEKISLDDPIYVYFPEYCTTKIHPWIKEMTIKHMLMMRTCHATTTYDKFDTQSNWIESFFITTPTHKPGTLFHYDTSASHTLCALVEKLTNQNMLDYLRIVFLDDIGFSKESYLLSDHLGHSLGGSGLVAFPEDLLRLGIFLMKKGEINGKQLLSSQLIEEAISLKTSTKVTGPVLSESQGYGFQIWRGTYNSFVCYGLGGQLIICYPDLELLCVTTADTQGIGGGNQLIYNAIEDCIINPSLKKASSLPSTLSLLPLSRKITTSIFTRENLEFQIHSPSLSYIHLTFDKEKGYFSYILNNKKYKIPFGLTQNLPFIFPKYNMSSCASGTWLDETTFYLKIFLLDHSIGSIHFQFVFGKKDVTLYIKKYEETLFNEYNGHFYGISFE